MKTNEEIRAELQSIAAVRWEWYVELRQIASAHLEDELNDWLGADHGQGISSSDVSCHLIEMVRCGEISLDTGLVYW